MNKRRLRHLLTIVILVGTLVLFIQYIMSHPNYWQQLRHVSHWTILWVLLVNCALLVTLVGINAATLRLCGKALGKRENFLLTSYSSIANFFGPLQSGPGVRATYLKLKHKVRLRDYTLATLLYYGLFAFFSALFLLVGTRPWWQTLGALIIVGGFSAIVIRYFQRRDKNQATSQFRVSSKALSLLIAFTFIQVSLTAARYAIELHSVAPQTSIGQSISYTGAANFALFVSITPDGVGIREAFLVFSKDIHGVSTGNIVSANLIDRASYILFLGLLFLAVLSMHGKQRLDLKKARQRPAAGDGQ